MDFAFAKFVPIKCSKALSVYAKDEEESCNSGYHEKHQKKIGT